MSSNEFNKDSVPQHCPGTASESAGKEAPCQGCPNQAICASGAAATGPDPAIEEIRIRMKDVKHKIVVLSGKGGVGKSTVCAMLTRALGRRKPESHVALLDVDICGPSQPKMMGSEGETVHQSMEGWSPIYVEDNIALMSVGFLLDSPDDAVVWRGPRKNGLIKQFLREVDWGSLEYLLIDTPPGTSDEHLSIVQLLNTSHIDGAIVVTTPQEVSLLDVRKEINFCRKVDFLTNFLGSLEYLLIDTPPGTSDEHLSIVQLLNTSHIDGAIVVTTPQEVSLLDVRKEINFCRKVDFLTNFVGSLEYLLIDTPPGTSDEHLSIVQLLNTSHIDGAIVVTTPQEVSLLDVRKEINFCRKVDFLTNFVGSLEYLLIDTPPGTSDEHLSIVQLLNTSHIDGAIVVTTPQEVSLLDVRKEINFCRKVDFLTNFVGSLEYLLIDTPPGTSDEHLSIVQLLNTSHIDGAIVVTTPQEVSLLDVRKEINFCRKVDFLTNFVGSLEYLLIDTPPGTSDEHLSIVQLLNTSHIDGAIVVTTPQEVSLLDVRKEINFCRKVDFLTNFVGSLEYLLIDTPPGTSDEHLSIVQLLNTSHIDGAIVVTTPQEVSLLDVRKEINFCRKVDFLTNFVGSLEYLLIDTPPGTSDEHLSIVQLLNTSHIDGAIVVTTPQEVSLLDVRKEINFCRKVDFLTNFVGSLEYLLIDTPPGTSDEHLSIVQLLNTSHIDGAIVVTTPQEVSLLDVRKEINFCRKVDFLTNFVGSLEYLLIDTPPGTSDEHLSIVQLLNTSHIDGAIVVTTPQEVSLLDVRKEINFCRKVDFLTNFVGSLEYLLIDTPPGTSDEHLSIVQLLNTSHIDGAIVVTTPQEVSLLDVRKEINFCRKVKLPILGVVENMSAFTCPKCSKASTIFPPSTGGAPQLCSDTGLPLLARIPLDPRVGKACDNGEDFLEDWGETPAAIAYFTLADGLIKLCP